MKIISWPQTDSTKHTRSRLKEQQDTLDKPYVEYQRCYTKKAEHIYPDGDRSQEKHQNNENTHDPEGFNNTYVDLPEMAHGFKNPFKTKFSDTHNYVVNQSLKIVNVNMETVNQRAFFDSGATRNVLC